MAQLFYDRVKETATVTGTSNPYALAGAEASYQAFGTVLANGGTCFYCAVGQTSNSWETGLGTYTTSGDTLARTTVRGSSNSNNAVNWGSETIDIFLTQTAYIINNIPQSTIIGNPPTTTLTGWQNTTNWSTDGTSLILTTPSSYSSWWRNAYPTYQWSDISFKRTLYFNLYFATTSTTGLSAGMGISTVSTVPNNTTNNNGYLVARLDCNSTGAISGWHLENDGVTILVESPNFASPLASNNFYSICLDIYPTQIGRAHV